MDARFIALFYLALLLLSPLAAAVPEATETTPETVPDLTRIHPTSAATILKNSKIIQANAAAQDYYISFQALPNGGGICRLSSLTPEEVQRLRNNVLIPGLDGAEISAGTPPDTDREKVSDQNTLLVPNPLDDETAFQKQVPTEILQPGELAPLQNQRVKGEFAFGVSIYDTLRAARCKDESCAIAGERLQLRNSGEGIKGNVKNIIDAVTKDLNSTQSSFSSDEADYLRAQIQAEQTLDTPDANKFNVDTFTRVKTEDVMNHIRVDNTWQGGILTNCDDGHCFITLYSMFDKYFNAWFSGELVIGTFGPTAWGQFKRLMTRSKRFNLLPAKITDKMYLKNQLLAGRVSKALKESGGEFAPMKGSQFFQLNPGNSKEFISGIERLRNFKKRLSEESDFRTVTDKFFAGGNPAAIKSGGYSVWEGEAFGPEGVLNKITDFDRRKNIFTYIGKVKEYSDITKVLNKRMMDALEAGDTVNGARQLAAIGRDFDDFLNLDIPELMRKDIGVTNFDQVYIRASSNPNLNPQSLTGADGKFFDEILDEFAKTGDFSGVTRAVKVKLPDGRTGLQTFKLVSQKDVSIYDELQLKSGGYGSGYQVRLNNGTYVPADPSSIPTINQDIQAYGGKKPYIVLSGYEPDKILTPEDFAGRLVAGDVWPKKIGTFSRNIDGLYDSMIARDWGRGGYSNLLSKGLQSNDKLIKNYFNVLNTDVANSGLGWTAKMYGYWWLTSAGGKFDSLTLYQLPREWTEVRFVLGESDIYNDAYIDYFSNEGSDTGDIFQRVISHFPVPLVLGEFAEKSDTVKYVWDILNQSKGRSHPENLAMFMFGAPSCPGCSASLSSPSAEQFDIQYISPESVNSFFLEHAKSKEAKDDGQSLVTFAHHANVEGKMKGEEMDPIDLIEAREDEETCEQVSEEIFIYGSISKVIGAEKIGAALALTENVAYLAGGMFGTFFTLANQLLFASQLNACVDDKEGYFTSLFVPEPDDDDTKGKSKDLQKNVSENALDGIREFANAIDANHPDPSFADKSIHEATSKVKELVDEGQKSRVAEAELRITGSSSGYLRAREIVYFWGGPDSLIEPTRYVTDGKTVLTTEDGHTLTLDNGEGTLTVDGQEVIGKENADHVRLSNKNLAIPAVEIPQRLNGFELGDDNSLLFTVNIRGEALVQSPRLLDCIQQAVMEQSGVPLNSNNMSEAFGTTSSIITDVYPSLSPDPINSRIIMGGQLPQVARGIGASINVFGDRRVLVTGAANPEAGNFQSGLWENGSIIYKPQTRELLIWLRHHQQAIVSDQDVKDFQGNLTNTINPLTQCDEPAVDLSVATDPATPATKLKGDNLTAGLKKNGPFQTFETDTKRFTLYSKLVDGDCKPFFKVENKITGEVYDQAIDNISQAEDGTISIKTADGQTHSLKFSDENGKPVLTYDGMSEVLRSASGKGGSFYYDPNKGLYYAENAQFLPLSDNFKNQGVSFQANPDGSVSGKPGDNVFVINPAQGSEGLFNIPGVPENMMGLVMMVLLLGIICAGLYVNSRKTLLKV